MVAVRMRSDGRKVFVTSSYGLEIGPVSDTFCFICGEPIESWDMRAEWEGRICHDICVEEQDMELDDEYMEDMGWDKL